MAPPRQRAGASGGTGPTDLMDADISHSLARLFDPVNLDHIPESKRMDLFEHRDLGHIKHYKAAVKIFGGPASRKRIMIAPPMETPMKHRLGEYLNKRSLPGPPVLNTDLQVQKPWEKPEAEELIIARQAREREDNYRNWFKKRQIFRNDLENMGLSLDMLLNKPNKSVLEERVLRQLQEAEERLKKEQLERERGYHSDASSDGKRDRRDSSASSLPKLKMPSPLGLKILEQHLKEKKMRLVDLFTATDKNKDWKISRKEFMKSCRENEIPISKGLLEDMLISLDMNMDENLDYKEFAQGIAQVKRERRENKRKLIIQEQNERFEKISAQKSDFDMECSPVPSRENSIMSAGKRTQSATNVRRASAKTSAVTLNTAQTVSSTNSVRSKRSSVDINEPSIHSPQSKSTIKSETNLGSTIKSSSTVKPLSQASSKQESSSKPEKSASPMHLEPPDIDTQPEVMVQRTEEAMVDLRKRDREALKNLTSRPSKDFIPGTILTGVKAIDDHCMRSTLEGDMAEMVNKFRQERLAEYFEVIKLCKERDVILTPGLLEKVLLYPPEKPHHEIKTKIRQPESLLTRDKLAIKCRAGTLAEEQKTDSKLRSKSGVMMADSKHAYPPMKSVSNLGERQNLSTGRAIIKRRVDCYMSFEEYEWMITHMAGRYKALHGPSDPNHFWPGHLLDKLRLCMPPYDKEYRRDKQNAIFMHVSKRLPAVNYGYETYDGWPINDEKRVLSGTHDPYKRKTELTNKVVSS